MNILEMLGVIFIVVVWIVFAIIGGGLCSIYLGDSIFIPILSTLFPLIFIALGIILAIVDEMKTKKKSKKAQIEKNKMLFV